MGAPPAARTLGELRAAGLRRRSLRDELRANLLARIRSGTPLFPSVLGYDDSVVMGYTDPPLTTVRQAVEAMAEAAAGALVEEIAGRPAPRDEYVFGPELVVRGSTGAAPARG